jgi:hypothetical protein
MAIAFFADQPHWITQPQVLPPRCIRTPKSLSPPPPTPITKKTRHDLSPSPVSHALETGSGHHARHRAPSSSIVVADDDDDDDSHDKVALIQKLVSLEGGAAAAVAGRAGGLDVNKLAATGVTLGYFALWFALNVYYNIVNKHVRAMGWMRWMIE